VLSDCQIREAIDQRASAPPRTPGQVYRCLGCSAQCGRCARTIKSIMDAALGACAAQTSNCSGCPIASHPHPDEPAEVELFPLAEVERLAS
jgi:bacterioferritin-associated ferredoxin